MATDTRTVRFDFIGNDRLSPAMEQMGRSAETLHGKLAGLATHIGGALVGAAKNGALALAGMATGAVVFGVKTAASMEQAQVAFTTMLGSATKARAFLGELQKFAASTPFEFADVTQASQRLMAMGISAKNVIPYLTAIGDAVAGLGGGKELIDQVTLAIGQMAAKGRIQGQELLQLEQAGIPALKILAAQYGVTAGQMDKMVTSGKVMSSDALPKLIAGIEKGTKQTQAFGGMMEAQSHTLSGLWSNLKDNVSAALGNMVTPFMPVLKRGLSELVNLTGDLSTNFQTKLVPAIKTWAKQFREGFSIFDDVRAADPIMQKLGTRTREVADWCEKYLIPAIKDLWKWVETVLAPSLEKYIKNWLPGVRDAFNWVSKAVHDNQGELKTLGIWLGAIVDFVVTKMIPIYGTLQGNTLRMIGIIITGLIKTIGIWVDSYKGLYTVVTSVMNGISKGFIAFAGLLIHQAAIAFGWIPGLGPKLKEADKNFQEFANSVNRSVGAITLGKTVNIVVRGTGIWGIAGALGAATQGLHFPAAEGGRVPATHPGATRARDSVPAILRVDEHVWTPEEVDAAGGHDAMFRLRKAAKEGLLKGFSSGGPVGVGVSTSTPSRSDMYASTWSPLNNGIYTMLNKIADTVAKLFGGATAVVAAARSQIGLPYSWGGGGTGGPSYGIGRGAGTYGFDCSGLSEYAWYKGTGGRLDIGGVTDTQWASSSPIGGPRPGALAFPEGPSVHVMIGSDKPGYVIQAPHTGAFVEEVPRSSGNWRWPNGASFYHGGPVGQLGTMALQRGATREMQAMARAFGIIGRETGGPVFPGTSYLVGERGPEIYTPRSPGTISPTGSTVVHQNITLQVNVPPTADKAGIGKAVTECLFEYKRRGGRLVSP